MDYFVPAGRLSLISRVIAFVLLLQVCAVVNDLFAGDPPPLPTADVVIPTEQLPGQDRTVYTNSQQSLIPSVVFSVEDETLRVEPYGSLWANMHYASSRTIPGAFTLWVPSEEDQGESAFEIDARRSRIGAHLYGPVIDAGQEEFESRGRVEVDFFGQFLTQNRAGVRLRYVYWEAESESTRYLIGQADDVISPLLPGTLNFVMGRSGGNLGFRRAQFLLEKTFPLHDSARVILQGSLNQDIIDDFPTDPGVRSESANWPVIQARVALQLENAVNDAKPVTLGLSGHVGETGFDFLTTGPPPLSLSPADDVRIKTWSINADVEVPVSESTTLRGEWFRGANLSPFLGGIGQGVCPCLRRPIHSDGGWVEVVQKWTQRLESHLGAGIDDPEDEDSLLGRTQNTFVFGNLIFHLSDHLSTGGEVTWWKTLYHEERGGMIPPELLTPDTPGEAITLEWMVRYDF